MLLKRQNISNHSRSGRKKTAMGLGKKQIKNPLATSRRAAIFRYSSGDN